MMDDETGKGVPAAPDIASARTGTGASVVTQINKHTTCGGIGSPVSRE